MQHLKQQTEAKADEQARIIIYVVDNQTNISKQLIQAGLIYF